jgi:hypothetical protein
MKLRNKPWWIVFFAAILLSGKVAAAVQSCAHHMSRLGELTAAEAHSPAHARGVHAADYGSDGCCRVAAQEIAAEPTDCCTSRMAEERRASLHCIAGAGSLESPPPPLQALPYGSWTSVLPVAPPAVHIASPPFAILFKNFRS